MAHFRSDLFSKWPIFELSNFEVTTFRKWTIFEVTHFRGGTFSKWPIFKNDQFFKWQIFEVFDFEVTRFQKLSIFEVTGFSKWPHSYPFPKFIIKINHYLSDLFLKWAISSNFRKRYIFEMIHFANRCIEMTYFWNHRLRSNTFSELRPAFRSDRDSLTLWNKLSSEIFL